MKALMILASACVALHAGAKQAFAMQNAKSDLEKAIENTRTQKSYHAKFKAVIEAPGSDSLVIEGETVWVHPGVLYIKYAGSGGDRKNILRVGEKVWVYHELLGDWVSSEEMGTSGAGRGVQNPDDVLSVLVKYAGRAKPAGDGHEIKFSGDDIQKIMKEQASEGTFDYRHPKTVAGAKLFMKDGLLTRFTSTADLISTEENLKGKVVKYSADVEILSYGQQTSLAFTVPDEVTKKPTPVEVPPGIRAEVDVFLKRKP